MRASVAGVWKFGWLRAALALVLVAGCAAAVAASDHVVVPAAGVMALRLGGDSSETRVVIDLDRPVSAKVASPDGPSSELVVDLAGVGAGDVSQGAGRGLVDSWNIENRPGGGRLTLRLAAPGQVRRRFLLTPTDTIARYRYVIDVDCAGPAPTARDAAVVAAGPPSPPIVPHGRKVVVIDAGHGGQDPGAQSARNSEKTITLEAAFALKSLLERGGRYKVVMTRSSDVYVPLEQRVQLARRAGADLFISLHADSAGPDAGTHGASVYTLSDQGGSRVTAVLDRHEWFVRTAARSGDPAVGQILLDLTQRSTRNRSSVFAQILVDRIAERVDLLPRSHRDAGYFVLLAPDVPAALLEMGFITSPEDEKRLVDPVQRRQLMAGVAEAIDTYFASQARIAAR